MLKEIAIVTITVANLSQVEQAWQEQFDYRTVDQGTIGAELAAHWQAPAMAGDDFVLLQPPGDAPVFVRLIADAAAANYRPMTSHGWNATELLVRDPDQLAAAMRESPFSVIGEPRDLWPAPGAPRVMQALGPGNELLYLTRNNEAAAGLGLDDRMPPVERPFIMVAGGPSMAEFEAFYGGRLGLPVSQPQPFRITMISKANGLPLDTTYPLAVVNLAPGYLIEVDELPADIGPRLVADGRLPTGVAIVSFTAEAASAELHWLREPAPLAVAPYNGRAVGLLRGPGGELLEIILEATDGNTEDDTNETSTPARQ